jgi:hypothetical protein
MEGEEEEVTAVAATIITTIIIMLLHNIIVPRNIDARIQQGWISYQLWLTSPRNSWKWRLGATNHGNGAWNLPNPSLRTMIIPAAIHPRAIPTVVDTVPPLVQECTTINMLLLLQVIPLAAAATVHHHHLIITSTRLMNHLPHRAAINHPTPCSMLPSRIRTIANPRRNHRNHWIPMSVCFKRRTGEEVEQRRCKRLSRPWIKTVA